MDTGLDDTYMQVPLFSDNPANVPLPIVSDLNRIQIDINFVGIMERP